MDFLRNLFGTQDPEAAKAKKIQKQLIRELNFQSSAVAENKAAMQRFEEANPLIASMGVAMFMDAPPPGFEAKLQAKLQERDRLAKQLSEAKKEEENIRAQAALKLGELPDSNAVQPLIAALKDEYSSVRSSAAEALGIIGDDRAIEPLTELVQKDSNEDVRKAAQQSIEMIQKTNP